jgi:hypothetical protein
MLHIWLDSSINRTVETHREIPLEKYLEGEKQSIPPDIEDIF